MLAITLDQTQIKFVLCDLMHDMRSVLYVQLHPALRVALHEAADQQRGEIIADCQGCPDMEGTEPRLASQQVLDGFGLVEQADCLRQQLMAQGIEPQAFACPIKQLAA